MKTMTTPCLRLGVILSLLVLVPSAARALPRYSARYAQKCGVCHVNPTGGGLRTIYARSFVLPEQLAWTKPSSDVREAFDPQISKNVTIGTDFRLNHRYSDDETPPQNFFQMQGDIYLEFRLDENLGLYYDQGINSNYELFGTWRGLPGTGYLKAGRFVPSYGWKFDDHTMFTREQLGFFPPANSDVGVEFGIAPGGLDAQLSVLNGNRGSTADGNQKLATALNTSYRFGVGAVGAALGVAGYWEDGDAANYGSAGAFGFLRWRQFAWLYEVDWTRDDPDGAGHVTGWVASHELSWQARRGLELMGTYDFFDPDFNAKTGAATRWGGGVTVMPRAFLAVQALVRATDYDEGTALSGDDFWESALQFHLLY